MSGFRLEARDSAGRRPQVMRFAKRFALVAGVLLLGGGLLIMALRLWSGPLVAQVDAAQPQIQAATPPIASAVVSKDAYGVGTPARLGELTEHPETFARSSANPFACPPEDGASMACDWEFDPTVARSAAEVEWMALQGYPTREQRAWAKAQTTEAILLEARRTGSAALWSLGLERAAVEAPSLESAAEAVLELNRVATTWKSLYALERQGVLQAHLIEMAVMKGGWSPADRELRRVIDDALSEARSAGLQAALLGDGAAMQRVHDALRRIPGIMDSPLGVAVDQGQVVRLGGDIRLIHQDMQRNAAALRAGRPLPYGGFTLADIRPRPVQSNVIGDGRPGGQWLEY